MPRMLAHINALSQANISIREYLASANQRGLGARHTCGVDAD